MKTRVLGPEKVAFSAIGYGCPPFQGKLPPDDEARALRVLDRAVELGVTYIDAADHNKGNNEELLAPFLKGKRDRILLSTKFGNRKGYPGEEARPADGRPEMVARYVEASLKRLGTDHVDVLYLHRVDPNVPIEDTVGAMKRLVEGGMPAEVEFVEDFGDSAIVNLSVAGQRAKMRTDRRDLPAEGARVRIVPRPGSIHLFSQSDGRRLAS